LSYTDKFTELLPVCFASKFCLAGRKRNTVNLMGVGMRRL